MPCEFDDVDFNFVSDSTQALQQWKMKKECNFSETIIRSTSPLSSSSALSSVPEKCGGTEEDNWENVFSDFQNQPMIPYLMGNIEDPVVHQGFNFGDFVQTSADLGPIGDFHESNSMFPSNNNGGSVNNPILPISHQIHQNQYQHEQPIKGFDEKPQFFNGDVVLINQHYQTQPQQNPALFLPLSVQEQHQEQHFLLPPNPKRLNTGSLMTSNQIPRAAFLDSGQEMVSPHHQIRAPKNGGEEMMVYQHTIKEQIFNAVQLIEMGNTIHAQAILARLNHQLSPIGKPFQRVVFYFKESLNLLLNMINNNGNNAMSNCSPFSLVFKIGAYKSFSEISPVVQFANFTCNQAILEALEGFERIHVIDFEIGYGGQWASLMQELALRNGGPPSLKITALASPSSTHDDLELGLTRANLYHFAQEINIPFEFEIVNFDLLDSMQIHVLNNEGIAVNLPISAFSNYSSSLPFVLRFVKQLSPKIVVSLDRGCDRSDLSFADHVIHALQSYATLLESVDDVHVNIEALQKIERFLIHPGIEKIIMGRHRCPEKTLPWKNVFLASGFSPLPFSNFTESQADCLVKRTPVRGFHIEKRRDSLVLCWQQQDLISALAWRCC